MSWSTSLSRASSPSVDSWPRAVASEPVGARTRRVQGAGLGQTHRLQPCPWRHWTALQVPGCGDDVWRLHDQRHSWTTLWQLVLTRSHVWMFWDQFKCQCIAILAKQIEKALHVNCFSFHYKIWPYQLNVKNNIRCYFVQFTMNIIYICVGWRRTVIQLFRDDSLSHVGQQTLVTAELVLNLFCKLCHVNTRKLVARWWGTSFSGTVSEFNHEDPGVRSPGPLLLYLGRYKDR